MATQAIPHAYSPGEEIAHSLTAALGVALMLIGIPWLVVSAVAHGGSWRLVGAVAFGLGALMMFGTSIVKGFAVTLALGVVVSMFTAITATRVLLHLVPKQLGLFGHGYDKKKVTAKAKEAV